MQFKLKKNYIKINAFDYFICKQSQVKFNIL